MSFEKNSVNNTKKGESPRQDSIHTSKSSSDMLKSSIKSSTSQGSIAKKNVDSNFYQYADKQKMMENFLVSANNEYTPEEMKKFLKEGIMANGYRMMKVENCDWYYDYYQHTKSCTPPVKELNNATVNYYHYTTPFETQLGTINLVMMHCQVNFDDGTYTPADRSFKFNALTPEMIEKARIQAEKYKVKELAV